MAGRLKRRSIIGRRDATRESFGPAPIAVGEVLSSNALLDSAMGEDEEAAERKARNLQRRQNQVEQEVQESPGLERQGSSRRSVGGGISGLSNAQLAEHYQHCLKLSAENKVSAKNAFNLQLIDWMAQAIVKKRKHGMEGEVDMSDFQIAAGTLDASTKIYAFRVDSVYNDVFKLASGLGQSKQPEMSPNDSIREGDDGETGEIDPASGEVLKKKKRIKKGSTIEKNLKNINISKMELEFDVDPLFKKTTSQFDVAGGGGNQFLASLRLRDESGELLMDSDTIIDSRDAITPRKTAGPARIPPILSDLTELQLCPDDLREFSFMKWNLEEEDRLNKSISASQEERSNENAFDAFAVPEPVDDYRMEETEGMVDNDIEDDYDEATVVSERAVGHAALQTTGPGFTATLQMSSTDMLSILTSAPLEYSYFDTGKLGAWAGPKHWKFKSLMNAKLSDQVNKGGRKKKEISKIDYDEFEEMVVSMMNKVTDLLKLPKKSVKLVEKTMKGWNRERSTLPEDLHYSGHELVRLKHVVGLVVAQTSKTEGQAEEVDEDVGDYDYENAGDNDGYCPDLDSQEDAYVGVKV